jgi:Lysozyme like domain
MILIILALVAVATLLVEGLAMASDKPIQTNDILPWPDKFDFGTLVGLAQSVGFSGQNAAIAAAIALAESSGDPKAQGDFDPNGQPTSLGLWQIHFTVHPEFDPAQLTDPVYNAQVAFTLYNRRGGNFTDWTTYKTGAYKNFLQG